MKALKRHTHAGRQAIVEELTPLVREMLGDNLIAFASQSSFARNEDASYSDLELIIIVKELPGDTELKGASAIIDGMLVEITCTTVDGYIAQTKRPWKFWHIAGSDRLSPIINESFVNEMNAFKIDSLEEQCMAQAVKHWPEVQEASGKVLNAVDAGNREALALLASAMMEQMLILLAELNFTPYITFAKYIAQAKQFDVKPACFIDLIEQFNCGCPDPQELVRLAIESLSYFEQVFADRGCDLYKHKNASELLARLTL